MVNDSGLMTSWGLYEPIYWGISESIEESLPTKGIQYAEPPKVPFHEEYDVTPIDLGQPMFRQSHMETRCLGTSGTSILNPLIKWIGEAWINGYILKHLDPKI